MPEEKKQKTATAETIAELDSRLSGLLGALGSSLSEVLERLEDSGSAEFHRAHDIKTPQGPLRAETGVRIRFAGQDIGASSPAQPVNRPRRAPDPRPQAATREDASPTPPDGPGPSPSPAPAPRQPDLVSYTSGNTWFLCADLPGVSPSDLTVTLQSDTLPPSIQIQTKGQRRYIAEHLLPPEAKPATMSFELRNGVLEIAVQVSTEEERSE